MMSFKRLAVFLFGCFAMLSALAQPVGHLGVPGMQMIRSDLGPLAGQPPHYHYLINVVHPDTTYDTLTSGYLAKQTLVFMDITLIIARTPTSDIKYDESGELYLGEYDTLQKNLPIQDQMALLRFRLAPYESRQIVRVSLPAGRAYSGYRQPVLINYGQAGMTSLNVRVNGYLVPN